MGEKVTLIFNKCFSKQQLISHFVQEEGERKKGSKEYSKMITSILNAQRFKIAIDYLERLIDC